MQPQQQPFGIPQQQAYGQPQQQAYGQPQQQAYGQPHMTGQPQMRGPIMVGRGFPPTSAQTALILSIVSLFFGGICLAIPALVVANGALGITNQIPGHPDAGTAKTAMIISWIVIGLTAVTFVLFFLLIVASS
jgi:hypothetical protein